MPIKVVRIDDRYIHGQVTVGWVNTYGIDEIWVVDDKLATNEFLKKIQLAMAPPGKKVEIITIQEAIGKLNNKDYDPSKNIMITLVPTTCEVV
jgi:mannose/fructose/N-acetylgalactosamine-specific phosphotransferase system component IIB